MNLCLSLRLACYFRGHDTAPCDFTRSALCVIGCGWWPLVQLDSVLQFQVCTNMDCFVAQPFFHSLPVQSLLVPWKLTYNVKFLHLLIKFCFLETRTLQWSNNLVAFKVHITVTISIFFLHPVVVNIFYVETLVLAEGDVEGRTSGWTES